MRTIAQKTVSLFLCLFILATCFICLPGGYAVNAEEFDTNYGFVAKNASSRIVLKKDCVWLQAKTATTGSIFDYIYKTPVNPADFKMDYTVVNDTTRDNGTHSRFNIYILPSPNASLSDGVQIQLIQFALGADSESVKHTLIVGSGPDGGWNSFAEFKEDYSVNLSLYKKNGTFYLDVNGKAYAFSGANANLLNSFSENGGAYLRFTAHYQENGEAAYGGDYAIYNINGTKFGSDFGTKEDKSSDIGTETEDKFEGVYGDEIKGKLEFSRYDFNNMTPEGTVLDYSVTDDGLSVFGRNEENGFSSGVSYQNPLKLDASTEISYTIRMPDEVFCTTPQNYAEYSTFICAEPNMNFSGTVSLYLRASYKPGSDKTDSASAFVLEVIMWDNTAENPVVASNTVQIKPKTEAGHEHEISYRIVYDEAASCYKLYVNGQRASSKAVELSMTEYFNAMADKYFTCTVNYSTNDRSSGGFTDSDGEMIGMTIKSINGMQIVNEVPDITEGIDLLITKTTADSAILTWSKPVIEETDFDASLLSIDGYRIVRLMGEVDENGIITTKDDAVINIDNAETVDYTDTGLKSGTNYYYTVYAVRKNSDGSLSDIFVSTLNKRAVTLSDETATEEPAPTGSDTDATAKPEVSAKPSDDEKTEKSASGIIIPVIIGAIVVIAAVIAVIVIKKKKG